MKFRFVYVNRAGEQVEIESAEALRRAVVAGELHAGSLLYDGLTRDWAPARVHPIFRLIRDSIEETTPGRPVLLDDTLLLPEDAPGSSELDLDFAVDLEVDVLEDAADDDPVARFWEDQAREAERAELDGRIEPAFPSADVVVDEPAAELRRSTQEAAPEGSTSAGSVGSSADDELTAASDGPVEPAPALERLLPLDLPEWPVVRPVGERISNTMSMEVPRRQAALLILLSAVGGWAIADSWAPPGPEMDGPEFVHVASMYRVSTHFTRGHADVRTAAFSDMVRGMDALRARMGIEAPPAGWLGTAYLAEPSEYPEAAVYWGRYAAFVDRLREQEEEFFRGGYVARLQRKGITGTVLTIQVARALVEFREDRPRREVLYSAMEELGTAALALHGVLLEDEQARAEGRLAGAPGEGRELELRRVLAAMERVGGSDPAEDGRLGDAALAGLARLQQADPASD